MAMLSLGVDNRNFFYEPSPRGPNGRNAPFFQISNYHVGKCRTTQVVDVVSSPEKVLENTASLLKGSSSRKVGQAGSRAMKEGKNVSPHVPSVIAPW